MRGAIPVLLLLAALVRPAGAVEPSFGVLAAEVRFGEGDRATGRVDGDLTAGGAAAGLPDLSLDLGPLPLLAGIPEGTPARVSRSGEWRIALPAVPGVRGRGRLRIRPASGTFRAEFRAVEAAALAAAGPDGVVAAAALGGVGGADSVDFAVRGRRWSFRHTTPAKEPPPGGGGGGGGGGGALGTLAQGAFSSITTWRFEVVRDAGAWQALWTAHGGSGAPPSVDFGTEMVVGLWLGMRTSGGYSVTIHGVSEATVIGAPCTEAGCPPSGAYASALESVPGGSCAVPGVLTYPFHIVRAPRVEGPVLLELATRVDDCF